MRPRATILPVLFTVYLGTPLNPASASAPVGCGRSQLEGAAFRLVSSLRMLKELTGPRELADGEGEGVGEETPSPSSSSHRADIVKPMLKTENIYISLLKRL